MTNATAEPQTERIATPTPTKEASISPMNEALSNLDHIVGQLDEMPARYVNSLGTVLSEDVPTEPTVGQTESNVEFVNALNQLAERLHLQHNRHIAIINRISV